ncbi:MAG: mandelate racemase/muconate lactonizing enzyme family protein [Candidatus Hydrogenedentes bacterium]|nr:mandelate racemase/muconate lactonizing enzyme family protein [Candidatus Hydrogenedentota bacterium]
MRVNQVDFYYVRIPLAEKRPGFFAEHPYFEPSWIPGFRQSEVRFYLLRLKTDSGQEGCAAMPAMGTERFGLGKVIGPYLLGIDPLDIGLVNQRIQELSYVGMRNGWIDAAFWDLIGKSRGEPLWKVLGGTGGQVEPYASTGETHNHDPAVVRELVRARMAEGFKGIKLRVKHHQLEPMLAYVAAAREEAGGEMKIMVDANQGWPVDLVDETPKWGRDFAAAFAKGIEPYDVYWLEEPLNRGDFDGLAQLRANTTVPIAGGEMNASWGDFKRMFELESLDVFQPDAVLAGGTYAGGISVVSWIIAEILARRKAAPRPAYQPRFSPHTWTTGLGFVIGLHLVGVLPEEERSLVEYPLEGPWKPAYWGRYIKDLPQRTDNGRIAIPDGPGLGVEIDWDIIRRFGKRIYHGTKRTVSLHVLIDRGLKATLHLKKKREAAESRRKPLRFTLPVPPF